MEPLPLNADDTALIAVVDAWAALMEQEDYSAALAFTLHERDQGWTPALVKRAVKEYGPGTLTQHVTVEGKPTDIHQRKEVYR